MVDKGKAIMTQDSISSVRNIVGQGEGNSLGGGLGPNSGTLALMLGTDVNNSDQCSGRDTEADCDLSVIRNLAREPTQIKVPPVVRGVPFEGDSDDCQIIVDKYVSTTREWNNVALHCKT
ncbi:hypothetical protein YC2023_116303 [Brassica napus]